MKTSRDLEASSLKDQKMDSNCKGISGRVGTTYTPKSRTVPAIPDYQPICGLRILKEIKWKPYTKMMVQIVS